MASPVDPNRVPNIGAATTAVGAGAVSCSIPEVAAIGADILTEGGNAYDALVTMSWALTVLEPTMSGLFGVNTVLMRTAVGEYLWLDGMGVTPRALDSQRLATARSAGLGACDVLPPTLVASNRALHDRFGSVSWERTLAPAIELAQGWPVFDAMAYWFALATAAATNESQTPARYRTAEVGAVFEQPSMASALTALADEGPESFYSGRYAHQLVTDVQAAGGVLSLDDLAEVGPEFRECVATDLDGFRLIAPGWPNASYEAMSTVAAVTSSKFAVDSLEWWHSLLESAKRAAQDRIHSWRPEMTAEEVAALAASARTRGADAPSARAADLPMQWVLTAPTPGHTSHLSAADQAGNVACSTQTLGGLFGCQIWSSGLPVNGLGAYLLSADPNAPDSCRPRPGAPMASILEMLMCERNGRFEFSMGSPGGFVIPPAVAQATARLLGDSSGPVTESTIAEAVGAARMAPTGGVNVAAESRVPADVARGLADRGHELVDVGPFSWKLGSLHPVAHIEDEVVASADCRRGGGAGASNEVLACGQTE